MRTTAPSPAATGARRLARVLKAVLSLLVLAAAVAGLPLLLAWATPVVWAVTHDDLAHLLNRQDTGAVFLMLLVAVGWIGWAQFSFCAVRELIAQLRGRTWHAPRGMGAAQHAAALMIGSILVLLPTSSALASDAQAAPAPTAGLAPSPAVQTPQAAADTGRASPAFSASTPTSSPYTVRETRPAQTLWGIAERELGDGERWREIVTLNEGRVMTDGTVFRANSFLQPGWRLQMPQTAAATVGVRTQMVDGARVADGQGGHVVTVRSGDFLSKIAEEELGDGTDWPELFDSSQGKPQPDGLPEITDPDVIYAGQQVTVPEARSDQPHRHRAPGKRSDSQGTAPPPAQSDAPQTPGKYAGEAPAPVTGQSTGPAAKSPTPSTPSTRPAQEPGHDQSSPSEEPSTTAGPNATAPGASPPAPAGLSGSAASSSAPRAPATAPAGSPLNLRTVSGAGALLAAAVTAALALRRTLQRRRRKPGEKIAIAPETSPAEAQVAAAAEPEGADRLDVALRTLAHHTAQQEDTASPPLRAARIGNRTVEVLPEDLGREPVTPFTAGPGGWWILPPDAALLDEETAREVPPPYPGLVTIGSTEAGDLLLLNLAGLPALLLDGDPVHITEMCTSLALELGMSPWASGVEIVTVGFGEDLPQLLPTTRIAHMRQAAHALRDLAERLLEAHQLPETRHHPYLLLCASCLDEDLAWQFADVIGKTSTVPVTLIAPARSAAACFPEAEILNASLSEPQNLALAGTDITVQRLEHAAYLQITTALKMSGQPSYPAQGPWQNVPDELVSVQQPDEAAAQEPAPAAVTVSIPSPSAATDLSTEVFPALLAASSDPSGLHLLSPTGSPPRRNAKAGPDAKATGPSVPARPAAAGDTADAADDPGIAAEKPAVPQAQECEAQDLHAPEIRVLGPVEVSGVDHTGHGPKMAQLAALLYFRPGRRADVLCADMDPVSSWSASTLNARMQGLRSSLGSDSSGTLYVPRRKTGDDPYRLSPAVGCDWTRFLQLVEHALPLGPAGLTDLEKALTLVRGRPFGGRSLPWAEPYQQEMITRIIDVAHTVATYRTTAGPHHNLSAALKAVVTGLEVDDTAELLYRAWMRLEAARGNRSGLHTAITRVQQVNQALDCSMEMETTQLIHELLNRSLAAARRAP